MRRGWGGLFDHPHDGTARRRERVRSPRLPLGAGGALGDQDGMHCTQPRADFRSLTPPPSSPFITGVVGARACTACIRIIHRVSGRGRRIAYTRRSPTSTWTTHPYTMAADDDAQTGTYTGLCAVRMCVPGRPFDIRHQLIDRSIHGSNPFTPPLPLRPHPTQTTTNNERLRQAGGEAARGGAQRGGRPCGGRL